MTSIADTDLDESILEAYDFEPNQVCCYNVHPHHNVCNAVAWWVITGVDFPCDMPVTKLTCTRHAPEYSDAIRYGRWCECTAPPRSSWRAGQHATTDVRCECGMLILTDVPGSCGVTATGKSNQPVWLCQAPIEATVEVVCRTCGLRTFSVCYMHVEILMQHDAELRREPIPRTPEEEPFLRYSFERRRQVRLEEAEENVDAWGVEAEVFCEQVAKPHEVVAVMKISVLDE